MIGSEINVKDIHWSKLRDIFLRKCTKLPWVFMCAIVIACPELTLLVNLQKLQIRIIQSLSNAV